MTGRFPDRIETDRLVLERLSTAAVDVFEYYEICANDPGIEEVTAHTPWDPHETPKETWKFLRSREEAWESGQSADYLLRPKRVEGSAGEATGEPADETAGVPADETTGVPGDETTGEGEADVGPIAGACGLGLDWERRSGELGIWLRERFWGRGYSGERADALLTLAFDRLDLELVTIQVRAANDRSHRAVETYVARHGGTRDGRFRNRVSAGVDEPVDEVRYAIERSAYEDAAGTQTRVEIG